MKRVSKEYQERVSRSRESIKIEREFIKIERERVWGEGGTESRTVVCRLLGPPRVDIVHQLLMPTAAAAEHHDVGEPF